VAVNIRIAFASMSWKPSPPSPGGVVAMYQACSGSGWLDCGESAFMIACKKCLVMLFMVFVNVVE